MRQLFRLAQSSMLMDDATWARHANPWSVYSRMTILPLMALAIWSRVWLGWWALVPVLACLLWTWINPRLFVRPGRTDTWATEGTFGERLFMQVSDDEIGADHRRAVAILTIANLVGAILLGYGLVALNPWITLWGLTLTMGAKLWTFDRMVWLWREAGPSRQETLREVGEEPAEMKASRA